MSNAKDKLIELLETARESQKSRRIHVYVKNERNLTCDIVLSIANGKLVSCHYDNLNGSAALSALLELRIEHVGSFPWNAPRSQDTDPNLASIMDLMDRLSTGDANGFMNSDRTHETNHEESLSNIAQHILAKFYGDSTAEMKVREISEKFHPEKAPREFIEECRKYASLMVGLGADDQFTDLIRRFDTNH